MLTISAHQIGRAQPLFADHPLALPATALCAGPLNLRQLLGHVVRAELTTGNSHLRHRHLLDVLGSANSVQALHPQRNPALPVSPLEVEQALAAVLQAVREDLFLVVVDGLEVSSLDAPLAVNDDSRIAFVRLAALVGA